MQRKKLTAVLALLALVLLPCLAAAAPLFAGAGKVEIKLDPGMPLSGYGDRINKPSTGVHDPVFARALVIEADGKRAGVVSADLLLMTRELRDDVVNRVADLDFDFISLSATHTHYSIGAYADNKVAEIAVMGKYDPQAYEIVASALEAALRAAAADLKPAKFGAAVGPAPGVTKNRRHKGGPTDPTMRVAGIWTKDGNLMAVIMNHAIHPTTMPSQTTLVSGDNAGAAERIVEQKMPGAIAMYMNAGLGDQSPDKSWMEADWAAVDMIGGKLADSALSILSEIEPTSDVTLNLHERAFDMPDVYLRRSFECWGGLNQLFKIFGKSMMRDRGLIMGLEINDALFLFSPAELSYGVQALLEETFPDNEVFVVVHSNDIYGYVVTPEDYDTGGYETCMNFYGREMAPTLVEEFRTMMSDD